jgi:hypothetical protein
MSAVKLRARRAPPTRILRRAWICRFRRTGPSYVTEWLEAVERDYSHPSIIEEFYERFEGLCAALLDDPNMFGYCYTQLTDVFQEQNGIYGFDRSKKFDMDRIRRAQTRPAAIEANG